MFSFDSEIIDIIILDEGFNLSKLWHIREALNAKITLLEEERQSIIDARSVPRLKALEKKLYYLQSNVELVEEVMLSKEDEIFEFLICQEFCLN